jgi:Sec7 domain
MNHPDCCDLYDYLFAMSLVRMCYREQFIRNNRGINDGEDIPVDYLESLYTEIKTRQIQVRGTNW